MSGKRSRTKGHSFEREIAKAFREAGFKDAKRKLEYQAEEAIGIDLDGTGQFQVQCKRKKAYSPITAIFEIKRKPEKVPVLITKPDRGEAMAVLPLDDFLTLIKKDR